MDDRIKISCKKSNLKKVRGFLTNILERHHLSEVKVNPLVLAVDEVCANLIIHSYSCDPQQSIEVVVHFESNEKVVFEVTDQAEGFDIRKHEAPDIQEIIKSKKKGGVGLLLVKRIMDEIDFISKNGYSIIRLIKYL